MMYRFPQQYVPTAEAVPKPNQPMPQYSDFWRQQPNQYEQFAQGQGQLGQEYQDRIPSLLQQLQRGTQGGINRHMGNLMGGQKSLADDYVRRAAGAGIQRGGMNVAGGSPLESLLALQASKGLAGQYGQNYGQAVGYAQQDRGNIESLLRQLMQGAQGAYGNQLAGLGGAQGQTARRQADYGKDTANNIGWRQGGYQEPRNQGGW